MNELELLAAIFAIKSFCKNMLSTHILLNSANSTTVGYLNPMGGRNKPCCDNARTLWDCCRARKIWVSVAFIPGTCNAKADAQCRMFHENTEWELNQQVFEQIAVLWGCPDIDLFASRTNAKVGVFYSWEPDPKAKVIDAFSVSLGSQVRLRLPPYSVLGKVLQENSVEKISGMLVFPDWPTQPWFRFPKLTHLLVDYPILLSCHSPRPSSRGHEPTAQNAPHGGPGVGPDGAASGLPEDSKNLAGLMEEINQGPVRLSLT